jgi:integrase/recombinase XerD
MRFADAIEAYVEDMQAQGRMNSAKTERSYRDVLYLHAEDCQLRDPRQTTREDCKRTLARWKHATTQANRRSVLVSFYDWLLEEGHRKDNPARQTRRPRKRPAAVYRMTEDECDQLLAAARGTLEQRVVYLGVCAGLRAQELTGLQGRHFERPGFVWVSEDIAKGGHERWIPVVEELRELADEIRSTTPHDEYVLPVTRMSWCGNEWHTNTTTTTRPSYQVVYRAVERVRTRAKLAAKITPHTMRHAFADHIARQVGMREAQAMLGHANIGTTQGYVGKPTLDELALAVGGVKMRNGKGGHQ